MEIKVLGTGCGKCNKLEALTKEVLNDLSVQADIIKITDVKEIAKLGVLMTPGLVVNGQIKVSGKLPSKADLTSMITSELAK